MSSRRIALRCCTYGAALLSISLDGVLWLFCVSILAQLNASVSLCFSPDFFGSFRIGLEREREGFLDSRPTIGCVQAACGRSMTLRKTSKHGCKAMDLGVRPSVFLLGSCKYVRGFLSADCAKGYDSWRDRGAGSCDEFRAECAGNGAAICR